MIIDEFPGFSFHPLVQALLDAGEAEDTSWHNDAAPSVTAHRKGWVILSDAGADRAQWEDDGPGACRFAVWSCDADGLTRADDIGTDDPVEAVGRFHMLLENEAVLETLHRTLLKQEK